MKRLTVKNPNVNILFSPAVISFVLLETEEDLQLAAVKLSLGLNHIKDVFKSADIEYILVEKEQMQEGLLHLLCLVHMKNFDSKQYGELDEFKLVGE